MLIPVVIQIQTAFSVHIVYGQPLLWGFIPMTDLWLFYGVLLVYDLLKEKKISLETLENAYISVAWVSLFFFYGMSLFTSPAQYESTALVSSNSIKGDEAYFRFNMTLIFFGTIYYFIKAFTLKNDLYLIPSTLFLVYIIFFRFDRTIMAVTLGSMGLYFVLFVSIRDQFLALVRLGVPLLLMAIIGAFVFPEVYKSYILMFQDIYATLTGNEAEVGKASIRVYEMHIIQPYLEKVSTFLFGCGRISHQWIEGGFTHIYGYFFPTDLGLFGMIFMFGLFGTLLLYGQFLLAFYYIRRTKKALQNPLYLTFLFYLLTMFLDSLTNAFLVINAAQTMIVVGVLYYFYQIEQPEKAKL